MEILDQMMQILFKTDTIKKAMAQYQKKTQKIPIDNHNMNFRLFLSDKGSINLELLSKDNYGYYFKPIGYYTFDNSGNIENIYVLKEFENAYKNIKSKIENKYIKIVCFLSLEENTYIGLCSRATSNLVKEMFNSPEYDIMNHRFPHKFQAQNIHSNGLRVQVKTSMMGAFEAGLNDDNFELENDVFMIYQNNDGISLHCKERTYQDLYTKSLLGAFK